MYMSHGTFPIIVTKEKEGGYSVKNLTLEGCYSQGETVEEALANIKEATLFPRDINRIDKRLSE